MHHKPIIDSKMRDNFAKRKSSQSDIDYNLKPAGDPERNSSSKLVNNNFKIGLQNESN